MYKGLEIIDIDQLIASHNDIIYMTVGTVPCTTMSVHVYKCCVTLHLAFPTYCILL